MPPTAAATPKVETTDDGYTKATVKRDGGKVIDDITVRPSANGGFIMTESYRRTREGKRAMSQPDWMPPDPPKTFDSFEALSAEMKKCLGGTKKASA